MSNEDAVRAAAQAIRAELIRQGDSRHDGPYVQIDNAVDDFLIDGIVNLIEVAQVARACLLRDATSPGLAKRVKAVFEEAEFTSTILQSEMPVSESSGYERARVEAAAVLAELMSLLGGEGEDA